MCVCVCVCVLGVGINRGRQTAALLKRMGGGSREARARDAAGAFHAQTAHAHLGRSHAASIESETQTPVGCSGPVVFKSVGEGTMRGQSSSAAAAATRDS